MDDIIFDEGEIFFHNWTLSNKKKKIHKWIPPEPITIGQHFGICTFVTDDGEIVIQEAVYAEEIQAITYILDSRYKHKQNVHQKDLDPGTPVVARFHLDKKMYRAKIVKKSAENKYIINYLDFGNLEEVEAKYIHKKILCNEIPARATKLDPLKGLGPFSGSEIDFLHACLVERIVSCYVYDNETTCRLDNRDISNTLIDLRTLFVNGNFNVQT